MAILTVTELRAHIESDLTDASLQRLADASEEQIVNVAGSATSETESFADAGYPTGRDRTLYLSRPVSSITTVKERDYRDDSQTSLSADDYRMENTRDLIRLREGSNSRLFWAPFVEVVYVPVVDTGLRKHVQIQLVKKALTYSGFGKEKIGDTNFSHFGTREEVNAILSQLVKAGTHRIVT